MHFPRRDKPALVTARTRTHRWSHTRSRKVSVRDLVIALAAVGATIVAVSFAQDTPPSPTPAPQPEFLPSTVFDWTRLEVKPTRSGERRELFDAATATLDRLECHVTTLNAGEIAHPAHRHPDEELIFVKEGTLEVTINGVAQLAPTGSVMFYASNDLHGIRNAGDTRASYTVLRWTSPGHDGPKPPSAQ